MQEDLGKVIGDHPQYDGLWLANSAYDFPAFKGIVGQLPGFITRPVSV